MNDTIPYATQLETDGPSNVDLLDVCPMPFRDVPQSFRREVYGVPYVECTDSTGGTLWITSHGWNLLEHLDPAKWFHGRKYDSKGEHLSKGSGAVFRLPTHNSAGRTTNLVVKFSRMAQDLPLQVSSRFPDALPRHVLDESVFNDPFEEFALLEELRQGRFGPAEVKVRTKRPLAIYSPARRFQPWQLGRSAHQFQQHARRLANDQDKHYDVSRQVTLSIERQYITLFHWVRGQDAEALAKAGVISHSHASKLALQVINDLAVKGFRILDMKPNHIILRRRSQGNVLTRHGRPVYALVDFELLQRTEKYEAWRRRRTDITE